MPDYRVTSADPLKKAKAAADARFGREAGWLLTVTVCLVTSLIALVVVGAFATNSNAAVVMSTAVLPVGLATLAAFARDRRHQKRRTGLIDELWRLYTAEAEQARTEPVSLTTSYSGGGSVRSYTSVISAQGITT
jgi:hypothetical protein